MFASIVGIFKSTLAPMFDDEYSYDKYSVLLNLVGTSAAGLYVTEQTSKMVLGHTDAGETEGDDDELEVRFGITSRNAKTNQRRKVQMPAQTQRLFPFPAANWSKWMIPFASTLSRTARSATCAK